VPDHRVDLNDEDVGAALALDEGVQRRVAAVAAVPVFLAVDLHGGVELGQAGRGHDGVRGDIGPGEDAGAAAAHVGGGDMNRDIAGAHGVEVDAILEDVAQRVQLERVGLVGRKEPAQALRPEIAGRVVEREAPAQPVERRLLDRREPGGVAGRAPEVRQRLAGLARTAAAMAVRKDDRVHRAGAGAADLGDDEARVLEQPVEHAPGQRAVGAAALQREIDRLRCARRR
jgi:hypothetical protein